MRKVLEILFETVRIATFLPRSEKLDHNSSAAGHDDLTWHLRRTKWRIDSH